MMFLIVKTILQAKGFILAYSFMRILSIMREKAE